MSKLVLDIYRTTKMILFSLFKLFSLPFLLVPTKNRIVFSNYEGKGYYDNGKYITNELISRDLDTEIVWLVNDISTDQFPDEVILVKNSIINQFWYLITSNVWVDNSRKILIPVKKKNQLYIQTWHGGLGLKKVESDLELTMIHKFVSYFDSKATDIMISNSSYLTEIYIKSFLYKGEIKELGYPVNDPLFSVKSLQKSTIEDKITILFAPTFRGNESNLVLPTYFPNWLEVLDNIESSTGKVVNLIIRMHPSLNFNVSSFYTDNRILNGDNQKDIKSIIPTIDYLISDYSSCIFDGMIAKIPSILFVPDYDEYKKNRGLYFSLDELPFPSTEISTEISNLITNFNEDEYLLKSSQFIKRVSLIDDGNSARRVVNLILDRGGIE